MGWYQRWTSFVPFSSSVPARNPSQVAWYPLSNSPPDFRVPSTFQAGENFFPKKFNEQRKIATEEIYDKQREENRIFFFFLRRIRNIHSCQANCVTLARLFRFLPGLPVPRISFLSTVSRFLYKHAHTRAGGTMAPIGCLFFFKLFSINLLLLVFLFNVHVYIYVEIRKVISWYNNNNNLEQNFQVSQTFFRLINFA